MIRYLPLLSLVSITLTLACGENRAPGNDREAFLDPPPHAAEMATVGEALNGVSTELLHPDVMTDAEVGSIPNPGARCLFRYTRVGFPVFVFTPDTGVIKLNDKLVRLPASGDGVYRDGTVSVTFRELDDARDAQFAAELVLRLQGAPHELGFRGFADCSWEPGPTGVRRSGSASLPAG